MEEIAAARAAVKLGSAVIAAVAALRVWLNCGGGGCGCGGGACWGWDMWRPENLDWLYRG